MNDQNLFERHFSKEKDNAITNLEILIKRLISVIEKLCWTDFINLFGMVENEII